MTSDDSACLFFSLVWITWWHSLITWALGRRVVRFGRITIDRSNSYWSGIAKHFSSSLTLACHHFSAVLFCHCHHFKDRAAVCIPLTDAQPSLLTAGAQRSMLWCQQHLFTPSGLYIHSPASCYLCETQDYEVKKRENECQVQNTNPTDCFACSGWETHW